MLTATRLAAISALVLLPAVAQAGCVINAGNARCVSVDPFGKDTDDATRMDGGARFVTPQRKTGPGYKSRTFKTFSVPQTPTYETGDVLPDDVTILFNRKRHGLPAPKDGWTYFRVGKEVYRADLRTRTVIDRVNDHMRVRF